METNSSVTVSKNSKDSTTSLENRIEELTKTAGLDLVEFKKFQVGTSQTIRITINDPCKPVGHDQCFLLSKLIHESEPELKEKYNLEVWSPGIGRELKTQKDFDIFAGKLVEITFVNPKTAKIEGRLIGKADGQVVVNTSSSSSAETLPEKKDEKTSFVESEVSKVKLAYDKLESNKVEISVEDV